MTNPSKVHRTNINKKDFNLFVFFILSVGFFGSLFLDWNEILAGTIYTSIFVGGWVLIFMLMFILKDDNKLKPLTDFVKIPLASKLTVAVTFYTAGFLLPLIIETILSVFTRGLSVSTLSIPLFGGKIAGVQSFAAAEIGQSMAWKLFTIMYTAGGIETFGYNFVSMLVGVIFAILFWKFISDKKPNTVFVFVIALATSVAFFTVSHLLNGTYTAGAFVFAATFLLISNISIYLGGAFLSFWIGYHQSNNLIWLISVEGLKPVLEGFISVFGVVFLLQWGLTIFFMIRKNTEIRRDVGNWFSGRAIK